MRKNLEYTNTAKKKFMLLNKSYNVKEQICNIEKYVPLYYTLNNKNWWQV